MKKIELSQGKYALVDDSDFEWLNQWKWTYAKGYAIRRKVVTPGKYKTFYMHRLVNSTPAGFETDHINQKRNDNRKSNLRTVTHHQNILNIKRFRHNTTGATGVAWYKPYSKWRARIQFNQKSIHLGYYSNFTDALFARKKAEMTYFNI